MRESKLACILILIMVSSLIIEWLISVLSSLMTNGLISTGFPLRSSWLISIVFHVIAILVPLKLIQDMKLLRNVYIWIYAPFITFFLIFCILVFPFMFFGILYFIPTILATTFLGLLSQPLLSIYYILTGAVWLVIIYVRKRSSLRCEENR